MRRRGDGAPLVTDRGRRAAVVLPTLLLLAGLGLGGVAGWRSVTGRTAAARPPASPPPLVKAVEGPIGELHDLGEIAYADRGGAVAAVTADGSARRTLGLAGLLRGAPATQPTGGRVTVSGDGALADGYLDDGAPAAVRLADGQLRRLAPPDTVAAAATVRSADGAVVAACAGKRRGETDAPVVDHPATAILDRDGGRLASFSGCLLDLARDGSAALLPEPAGAGTGDESQRPVRGVRLWRRSGGQRPVLAHAAAVAATRLVDPAAEPGRVVVEGAWLAPDARHALVRVGQQRGAEVGDRPRTGAWSPGAALVLVDLATGRWRLVPAETSATGSVAWAPTGGFAYALPPDSWDPSGGSLLVTYVPPAGAPTLVQVGDRSDSRLAFSPDGDWLLLPGGGRWVFIRVDDPAVRVSYAAPGEFAGWLPRRGAR
ncbi:MAG TPA: hypothetical protein VF486_05650 [Actinomycetes bacterium]